MSGTKDFFDGYAKRWDDVNRYDKTPDDFRYLVSLLNIGNGSKVVDLGCGTGVLTPFLLEQVGTAGAVFAIDISSKMLDELSAKFGVANVKCVNVSAEKCELVGETCDAVICFSAFPHFEDQAGTIRSVSKLLKPYGRFLIAHYSSRRAINEFHSKLPPPICHHVLPDDSAMKKMLDEAMLETISLKDSNDCYLLLATKNPNLRVG